jgi:hypothetical protein
LGNTALAVLTQMEEKNISIFYRMQLMKGTSSELLENQLAILISKTKFSKVDTDKVENIDQNLRSDIYK